ncbi:MAG: Uma2 family endonuclease [Sumerlaeia bacterium]
MTTLTRTAKFSLADYHRMIDAGILDHRKVELIEGEIVEMSPSGDPHYFSIWDMLILFQEHVPQQGFVTVSQSPIALPKQDSEPEPDFYVARKVLPGRQTKPTPESLVLVVEVSESTLAYDRRVKLPLYARAGIAEFWIVNLIDDCIEVYRSPDQTSGTYAEKRVVARGESIHPLAFPDFEVHASAILPRKEAP